MRINFGLAGLALLISLALWMLVVNDQNPERVDTPDIAIPVEITKVPPGMVVMNSLEPVRFKIQAPTNRWTSLRSSSFRATVDLSRLSPGIHAVPVVPEASDPQISVMEVIPSTISVRLEEVQERTVPVKVNLVGNVPFGYVYAIPKVSPEVVVVSGPSSFLQTVQTASVDLRLEGITVDIDTAFHPDPVDSSGAVVRNVGLNPQTVRVQLPIQQQVSYKQVGIRPNITGTVATGYWIESVTAAPESVTVVGDPKALAGINYLDTESLSVDGGNSSVLQDLKVVTPPGASLVQQQQTVRLKVTISPLQTSQVMRVAPRVSNLDPSLRALGLPPYVDVTVQGSAPIMQGLSPDGLSVTFDASGLAEGTHSIKAVIKSPSGVQFVRATPDTATVVLSPASPSTPAPTPATAPAPAPSVTPTPGAQTTPPAVTATPQAPR